MSADESALGQWLEQRRAACGMRYEQIPWSACTHWRFANGALAHERGAFFSIVGVRAESSTPTLDGLALPMIDQPEIGILAFLLRPRGRGYEWLLQAKAEPGNVGLAQIAPTVQATESNFRQLHGGEPTPFLSLVRDEGHVADGAADVRQSEQGSMFLNKYNRNVAAVREPDEPLRAQWRWSESAALRAMLHQNFAVNTDARSVLVTTPWRFISANGKPFSYGGDAWSKALTASHGKANPDAAVRALAAARSAGQLETERIALDALPDCAIDDRAIVSTARTPTLTIAAYAVDALDREVKHWRQPLVARDGEQDAALVCAKRGGVLRFFLRFSAEIGFTSNRVQFGPSLQSDAFEPAPNWLQRAAFDRDAVPHCTARQSDEGGRFMKCITRYRVVEIPETLAQEDEAAGVWVTLGDLESLAATSGALTNEARSAISLLLRWA